jgi:acetyl esterase/lipase
MFILGATIAAACATRAAAPPVQWSEIANATVPPADQRIAYGPDSLHYGELRIPDGDGPFPIVVVIHGGCWQSEYDLRHAAAESEALRAEGMATWTIEYRRVGDPGGGWPLTFLDVARAIDFVPRLAARAARLDGSRVVLIGHSAGGHLALWAASPSSNGADTPAPPSLPLRGVVSLAAIADLRSYGAQPGSCNSAVPQLMGGAPDEHDARYSAANPIELVPLRTPVRLIHGALDPIVPPSQSHAFAARNREAGGSATVTMVDGAGHFDLIAPHAPAWSEVVRATRELLAGSGCTSDQCPSSPR